MNFSAVVVNYADSWALVRRCLASLETSAKEAGAGLEAVVVDNDEVLREVNLPAKVLRNGRNLGFARAVNRGISASSGEVVVLLNPDSTVGETFFREVSAFLDANPRAGVVGPRIFDAGGALQLSARKEISLLSGLLGRTSLLTKLLPENRLVQKQFPATRSTSPVEVDWVSGACLAVRRAALEKVGPLDERFFMYFEDADLCRRVRSAGYRVFYLPNAEVVHAAGGSTPAKPLAIWRLHKSAFLYQRKYGPHGPFGLLDALVLVGLTARALAKLAASKL